MKGLFSFFFRSAIILSLSIISIVSNVVFLPGAAQAANFGSLTDNGTAARMGIGTTYNPSRNLHVVGSPLFERAVDTAGFLIKRTATNRWFLGVNENPAIGYGFVISTFPEGAGSSTPRLLVMQDGNVGIGTTTPTAKLEVDGSIKVSGSINRQPTNPPLFRWLPVKALATYTVTGSQPYAIAFDGTNMWTANVNGHSVTKITPAGVMTTYAGTGANPQGIAFDGTNMWTANSGNNSVTKILAITQ